MLSFTEIKGLHEHPVRCQKLFEWFALLLVSVVYHKPLISFVNLSDSKTVEFRQDIGHGP